jgi:hypothetical protein
VIPFAAEAWQAVLFAGFIPIAGAAAVFFLIRYAVRNPPEEDED